MVIHYLPPGLHPDLCAVHVCYWGDGFTALLKNPRLNIHFTSLILANVHGWFVNCASVDRANLKKKKRKAEGFHFD